MKNTVSQVDKNWTLSLSPKADAFSATGVVDGHNVWRNQSVVKSAVNLPDSIPATVPGSAVSKSVIPASIAAWITAMALSGSSMSSGSRSWRKESGMHPIPMAETV